jgi:hypothetical protein
MFKQVVRILTTVHANVNETFHSMMSVCQFSHCMLLVLLQVTKETRMKSVRHSACMENTESADKALWIHECSRMDNIQLDLTETWRE